MKLSQRFTGVSPKQVILVRGEMTCLGGLIALVTYLVWPTWERTQAAQLLGRMLASYRPYFNSVTEARLSGQSQDEARIGSFADVGAARALELGGVRRTIAGRARKYLRAN
jgi:uncharacterized membrane protein YccC